MALLCVCASAGAQEPHIALRAATPEQPTVARYSKFELALDLETAAKNPFDPDQIDVEAIFTSPQGKTVAVPGFLYQEFTRSQENGRERVSPVGKPVWRVRFAPDAVGTWQYRVTAKDSTGTVALPVARFQVTASASAGFVRRARNNPAGFAFDTGRAYFPVGENMCWFGDGGTYEYDRWLADLHHAGGDWIRLWMWENRCGIDWRDPDAKYDPDGKAVNLHNAIWSAVASGDAGSAMIWWWDNYIDPTFFNSPPKNPVSPFQGMRRFVDTVTWDQAPWKPLDFDPPRAPEAAERFTDLDVSATMGWGKAAVSEFTLTPQGKVSAGQIPSFLYSAGKADLRTTPAFHVHFTHPGRFMVHVNQVSDFAKLQFLLDGKPAMAFDLHAAPPADKSVKPSYAKTEFESQYNVYLATYDKDYGIEVPAGEHIVTLDVSDGDWVSLTRMTLTGYRSSLYPDINLYGITDGKEAILWAQNPAHNWKNVYEHRPMPPLPASSLTLHGLKDGSYTVRWWDTVRGVVTRQEKAVVRGGDITLQLPSIAEDLAAQIVVDKIQ